MAFAKKEPHERIGHPRYARGFEPEQSGLVSRARSRRGDIPIPQASPKWLPQAQSWFRSLALSGQSEFYEASDWATAVAAAQAYDIFLRTYNAAVFANFVRLSERLGATITDRKRMRVELVDPVPPDRDEDAADAAVLEWHGRLAAVPDGDTE